MKAHGLRWARVGLVAIALAITNGTAAPARADWFCSPRPGERWPDPRVFSALDDNYFITGIPTDPETSTNQVKFQFSFKVDLLPNEGPCGVFFGYTQRSLWNLWDREHSSPFEDSNYNPQLFVVFGHKQLGAVTATSVDRAFHFLWARAGVEHESNGRGGDASRGWERVFAAARLGYWFRPHDIFYVTAEPKAWLPFVHGREGDGGGNPDLVDYVGYGQLAVEVGWHALLSRERWQDLNLRVLLRKGTAGSNGTVEVTLRYRPPWPVSLLFYGEAFFGHNETLLYYDTSRRALRIGIAFDDRPGWRSGAPGEGSWRPPP